MKRLKHRPTIHPSIKAGLALSIATALAVPLTAHAASFQLPTTSAAGWGRVSAGGSLYPNDPTAAFNNPAAMVFFGAPTLQVTATGIRPSAEFRGSFRDQQGKPVSGNNPNGFGKFEPFPNIAFVAPINDRFALGASLSVPYGLVSKYNPTWQGRYFGTKTSLQSVALSFSAAFKVNDEFSLGLGIMGQRTKAQLNSIIDTTGAANTIVGAPLFVPQTADEQLNVNVKKKFAFGYFGGLVWKPTQWDTFDLTYHSRVKNNMTGNYQIYGGAEGKNLIGLAPVLDPSLPTIKTDGPASASARLDSPAYASVDWVHVVNSRFTVSATAQWTDWSSFGVLTLKSGSETLVSLPQKYKDSWFYSLGGEYHINPAWTLRAGIGYDQTPTNIVSRDPRIPDGTRRIVGVGVGYRASKAMSFDFAYQHQFVKDTPVHMKNQNLLGAGTMDGVFQDHGDVLSLAGTYQF
ncbi:MAG: long-chain fatty acid transporter [Rhodanobacter sp.]|nr:MAG: long-chain fatty acid transporter [Rhodanobacter sp.]